MHKFKIPFMNKCLLIFLSLCLCSCGNNPILEKKEINLIDGTDELLARSTGIYHIGLNEKKIIPLLVTDAIKKYSPSVEKEDLSLYAKGNCDIANFLEFSILSESEDAIIVTCTNEFEQTILVSELIFETNDYVFSLNYDFKFLYNSDYVNYPIFNPSFLTDSLGAGYKEDFLNCSWNNRNVFGDYITLNFDRIYDQNDVIKLNNIDFSDNLKSYIYDVTYIILDKELWYITNNDDLNYSIPNMISANSFSDYSLVFEDLRSIDFSNECGSEKGIVFKVNYKTNEEMHDDIFWICGDVIYDVEINGIVYKIFDSFIYFCNE